MSENRKIEIFRVGCPVCEDTLALVNQLACSSCEINILDMDVQEVAKYAKALGVCSA